MPVFRSRMAFEIARDMTAFLGLEAGVSRGKVPWSRGVIRPGRFLERAGRRLGVRNRASDKRSGEGPPIFFITGMSRSGTTWLMRLLDAHPEILCQGEGRFFGENWREPKMRELDVNKQPSSLHNALASSEYLRFWVERSVWSRDDDPDEHLDNLTRLAVDYFLTQELQKTGKRIVGDKTPLLGSKIVEEIGGIFPDAKVVHIVRDGRDRAVSLMHYLWNTAESEGGIYSIGPEELAKRDAFREDPRRALEDGGIFTEERIRTMATQWGGRVGRTAREGPGILGKNYLEVKYENLLQSPETEAERLFEFLGAGAGRETIGRCVNEASFERRARGREKGREDPTSVGLRKGVAGDWRSTFTERDRRIFKEAAGGALIEAGYEKDLDW